MKETNTCNITIYESWIVLLPFKRESILWKMVRKPIDWIRFMSYWIDLPLKEWCKKV